MNERYWDRIAGEFDQYIFDPLESDENRVILNHIDRASSKGAIACDYGCGIGRYLPILASRFKTIYAIDFSERCLDLAIEKYRNIDNIFYVKGNLANPRLSIEKNHFAISINVLITPSLKERMNILNNIFRHTIGGGHLLLVVPSLESAIYANSRGLEWDHRTNSKHLGLYGMSLKTNSLRGVSMPEGILKVEGVPTKHYLKEELIVMLKEVGFQILSISKIEYSWEIEFSKPPRWMKEPYPWEWALLCRKK